MSILSIILFEGQPGWFRTFSPEMGRHKLPACALIPERSTRFSTNRHTDTKDSIKRFETNPDAYFQYRLEIERKLASSFRGLWANSKAADEFTRNAKQHMASKIEDPHISKALLPTEYKAGCRRFTPADPYMEALNQSNVEFVSTSIERVERNEIITTDKKRRAYDVIVCGTGFEPYTPRFPIRGREGAHLSDLWSTDGGYESYLAVTVASFPNFFGMHPYSQSPSSQS